MGVMGGRFQNLVGTSYLTNIDARQEDLQLSDTLNHLFHTQNEEKSKKITEFQHSDQQSCIYPKCSFARCTRLAYLLSFASLFRPLVRVVLGI